MAIYRCHVNDVDRALSFYRALGFRLIDRLGPRFAVLQRARLVLWLCASTGATRRALPDDPAFANRLVVEVQDVAQLRIPLQRAGGLASGPVFSGAGGIEGLWLDPAGNTIELFQPL